MDGHYYWVLFGVMETALPGHRERLTGTERPAVPVVCNTLS